MSTLQPDYYRIGGVDVIEFCQRQGLSFTLGNVVKYVTRAGRKNADTDIEDLKKAREYIDREISCREMRLLAQKPSEGGAGGAGGIGIRPPYIVQDMYGNPIGPKESHKDIKAAPVEELERADRPVTYLDKLNELQGTRPGYVALSEAAENCPREYGWKDIGEWDCRSRCVECWLRPYKE